MRLLFSPSTHRQGRLRRQTTRSAVARCCSGPRLGCCCGSRRRPGYWSDHGGGGGEMSAWKTELRALESEKAKGS